MTPPAAASPQRYHFADLTLDVGQRRLWRGKETISLTKLTFSLLRVLVETAPNLVTHDEVADKVWGPRRTVTPENLAQHITILRRTLGDDAAQPRYIEAVRGQGYRLIPDVETGTIEPAPPVDGRPPGAAFSNKATADGARRSVATQPTGPALAAALRRVSPESRATASTMAQRPWIALAVIGLLVLAVGFFVVNNDILDDQSSVLPNSVAVLPFKNISPDAANEYFSEGMTEAIISKLSRVQDLQVTARTWVARFKGTDNDIREISEELGVRYVVEGSVRKDGDRVRITAQLINASTGFHVWADDLDFDGGREDIFAIQEETALKIAETLDLALSPMEEAAVRRRDTENPDAYDAYLQGWILIESFIPAVDGPEKLNAARDYFEQAQKFDPAYALAFVGLAFVEVYYLWDGEETLGDRARAQQYADRALDLDRELPQVHAVLGDIHAGRDDWAAAIAAYREAIRLDPQYAYAWEELAWALNRTEPVEAEDAAREAIRLNPYFVYSYSQLGWALETQGRYDEAVAVLEQALRINPAFPSASRRLARLYGQQGEHGKALAQYGAEREMRETPDPQLLSLIAVTYERLDDKENALAAMKDALESGYDRFGRIDTHPSFETLRSDPRFREMVDEYRRP